MNKRLSFFILFVAACLLVTVSSCNTPAAKQTGTDSTYVLNGQLEGLDTGMVYLVHRESADHSVDSLRADQGRFTFTGRAPVPEHCLLEVLNSEGAPNQVDFFLQNGTMTISGKTDSLFGARITGSHEDSLYRAFLAGQGMTGRKVGMIVQAFQTAKVNNDSAQMDSIQNAYFAVQHEQRQIIKNYALQHPSSYVSALELYLNFNMNPEVGALDSAFTALDPVIRNSFYGKKAGEVLATALKTAIGTAAPDFTLPDLHDRPIALSSFKGKYTLVDFWASWCGPCRAENPSVVKAFRKYHPRGLAILGVSLDNNKEFWAKAIRTDKLSWTQVSDLKGWQSSVVDLYGIKGIPMNFLLDKTGKIVGKDLRGKSLMEKLEEVVQ